MASMAIPFAQLRRFAIAVAVNEMLFVRKLDDYSADKLRQLLARAQQALKDTKSTKNRRLLRRLVQVLRRIDRSTTKQVGVSEQSLLNLQYQEEHRRELAKLAPRQLMIIGQTDVATYVTAQTNVRWASKRKRRS